MLQLEKVTNYKPEDLKCECTGNDYNKECYSDKVTIAFPMPILNENIMCKKCSMFKWVIIKKEE